MEKKNPLAEEISAAREVKCPKCGTVALYSPANQWRPFCSKRCQLTDLGTWAQEKYRIASDSPLNSEPDFLSEDEKN